MSRPLEETLALLKETMSTPFRMEAVPIGIVEESEGGVVWFSGLAEVGYLETILFETGSLGLVLQLEKDRAAAIILGSDRGVQPGGTVRRTGIPLKVPAGNPLLGRIVSPLGDPLDEGPPIHSILERLVEAECPSILERRPVDQSLLTGTKAIDTLFPIGKGQRELLLGDRGTGKSTVAQDLVIAQKEQGVTCIYASIGQKASFTAKLVHRLENAGALKYTTVVVAHSSDPPALRYLAPYAACALGEAFRDAGKDALVIFDDLSKHADAYRELSLLLNRSPSREAYPPDIFYAHARLLERAASLATELGGGSLSAIPIVETLAGNLTAFIPTNLISITDGQIYFDRKRFNQGILPAIDVGLSVSRVGGKAQCPIMKKLSGPLRLALAQYQELESYARFGAELDKATLSKLEHGKRVIESLKQPPFAPWTTGEEIVLVYAIEGGSFEKVPPERVEEKTNRLREVLRERAPDLPENLEKAASLDPQLKDRLDSFLRFFEEIS